MLSKKQASTLRGSITHLLKTEKELANVNSFEGPRTLQSNNEKAKRKVYGLIAQYTEKE